MIVGVNSDCVFTATAPSDTRRPAAATEDQYLQERIDAERMACGLQPRAGVCEGGSAC